MKKLLSILLLMFALCEISSAQGTQDRSAVKCAEDSPERRGEEGCTILANRPLSGAITGAIYWHIDRFNSLEDAKKAAGPNGVAAEAHGGVWLMTVEGKTQDHHGGRHVALIGPLLLPAAESYTMYVRSTLLKQGASSPVHINSGPAVWYIVVGEQCVETQKAAYRLRAGKFFILPADQIHRGRVQSAEMRGALVLILHDSKLPASRDPNDPPPLMACRSRRSATSRRAR